MKPATTMNELYSKDNGVISELWILCLQSWTPFGSLLGISFSNAQACICTRRPLALIFIPMSSKLNICSSHMHTFERQKHFMINVSVSFKCISQESLHATRIFSICKDIQGIYSNLTWLTGNKLESFGLQQKGHLKPTFSEIIIHQDLRRYLWNCIYTVPALWNLMWQKPRAVIVTTILFP